MTAPVLAPGERIRLGRRAQWLAGASVTYNVIEAVVAVAAGVAAGSVALIGFGLDSIVEVSSFVASPTAGLYCAQMGAEVIRVDNEV